MRLLIEIAAAAFVVVCLTVSSAAFAAGKPGRSADGLTCGYSLPSNASPAARWHAHYGATQARRFNDAEAAYASQ